MLNKDHFIVPTWETSIEVGALATTRLGGVSKAPYDSLNLGSHVEDELISVYENRHLLNRFLPSKPQWLQQIHGIEVVDLDLPHDEVPVADAAISRKKDVICAVQTADCLPVLFADKEATVVGAAHAGWRGLCDGVLEATIAKMDVDPSQLLAWLGAAIGPAAFEVGEEVRQAFISKDAKAIEAFVPNPANSGKWLANIYLLAKQRLIAAGVHSSQISGGGLCTYSDKERFFSYRRDKVTGRQASMIWLR